MNPMGEKSPLLVNGRILNSRLTGVQRYLSSCVEGLKLNFEMLKPSGPWSHGVRGHLWEQFVLPFRSRGALLWSPCNTGPWFKKNQVITVHDLFTLEHPEWFSKSYAGLYKFLLPKLLPRVRKIIAISEYTRKKIIELTKTDPSKIVVIPNGVAPNFRPQSQEKINALRAKLGLSQKRYLLCVASLEPRKNFARLLQAWTQVFQDLPEDVYLVVAGAAGSSRVFQKLSLDSIPERVLFVGYVGDAELPTLYSGALAFLFPSLAEGFGLPPLEAMACDVPTLCSNTTALPETVGEGAYLVDPLKVDEISQGIRRVALDQDLRDSLRAKARIQVLHLSSAKSAQLTDEVFRQLLGDTTP